MAEQFRTSTVGGQHPGCRRCRSWATTVATRLVRPSRLAYATHALSSCATHTMRTCVRDLGGAGRTPGSSAPSPRGNAMVSWAAALELEAITLHDALALLLLVRDSDLPRYEKAAMRWHARLCHEGRLSHEGSAASPVGASCVAGARRVGGANPQRDLRGARARLMPPWCSRRGLHARGANCRLRRLIVGSGFLLRWGGAGSSSDAQTGLDGPGCPRSWPSGRTGPAPRPVESRSVHGPCWASGPDRTVPTPVPRTPLAASTRGGGGSMSSNPAMSAASTPPPSATIQTFEPSLADAGVAALGASTTSSTRATGSASSPTPGSVLAGRGVSPAVSFA